MIVCVCRNISSSKVTANQVEELLAADRNKLCCKCVSSLESLLETLTNKPEEISCPDK